MGIQGTRFYFKQGLPKVKSVQEKFKEITGLTLVFTSDIFLRKLVDNSEDIIYHINRSVDEVEASYHPDFEGDESEAGEDGPRISDPYFYCDGFSNVYMSEHSSDEHSFAIQCGIRIENHYFFKALIKTMYELGGLDFRHNYYPIQEGLNIDDHLEPYYPQHREWKRIKKWTEMSDMEKDSFKGKYENPSFC